MSDDHRYSGTVKWFNATKGFGFITPDSGGEDLFVHQTNIKAEGFRSLRENEPVEYNVSTGDDGRTKATNVTGPNGAPPQGTSQDRYHHDYHGGGGHGGGHGGGYGGHGGHGGHRGGGYR